MPKDGRIEIRLDPVTRHDIDQLAARLNLSRAAAVRFALREACERRKIKPLELAQAAES